MKKFVDGGAYFVLTSFRLSRIPICNKNENIGAAIAQTICEDACYLSADGTGQTAIEIFRIAGKCHGKEIDHYITIRTHSHSETECVLRQEAMIQGMISMLHRAGYVLEEISYEKYRNSLCRQDTSVVWALKKQMILDYGIHGTYQSIPVIESVDWKNIYSVLDGSGCSLCIQIIPAMFSEAERKEVINRSISYMQAREGMVPQIKDQYAIYAEKRWKYYADMASSPAAEVNMIICGNKANAALSVARIRQAVKETSLEAVQLEQYRDFSVYNQPWKISNILKRHAAFGVTKMTSKEAAQLFQLPCQSDYFTGILENPYSLVPEESLLPEEMITKGENEKLYLGRSVFSRQDIFLSQNNFLLHTAVIGKSGVGKTTFLKMLIHQFYAQKIPVLIMEPIKKEYRNLVAPYKSGKIFTVENPTVPYLMNPFYVPEGVMLGEYRNCLLSAFKAAFSLPDPLPALFEKAISEAYLQYGWTDSSKSTDKDVRIFDMNDFIRVFKRIIVKSDYSNEVKGNMMSGGAFRLQSLIERCPRTFDTIHSTDVRDLLEECTVLEMGNLEPEQKLLVSALTLISILAVLKLTRKSDNKLRNIILIDEAHALLDPGESATVEENSLNNTMTQLMINILTEIRAYGVGIIFSDQTASRIGSCMLDNVDNIVSFRLSGEEAKLIRNHMNSSDETAACLPMLSVGEFFLKNQHLRAPLAIRLDEKHCIFDKHHYNDVKIAEKQQNYLREHAKDYCPYAQCECAGCDYCLTKVRQEAKKNAVQLYNEYQKELKTVENIAALIVSVPNILGHRMQNTSKPDQMKVCKCVAIHLLRILSMEKGITVSLDALSKLLRDLKTE